MKLLIFVIIFFLLGSFNPIIYAQTSVKSNPVITEVGDAPDDQKPIITTPAPSIPSGGGRGDFVYFFQLDPKYAIGGCHYGLAMCGPTALAMIMATFKVSTNPLEVDRVFQANGWRGCGDAPSVMPLALNSSWLRNQGFATIPIAVQGGGQWNLQEGKNYLDPKNGYLLLGSTLNHIFVIDDIDVSGRKVHVQDPIQQQRVQSYWADYSHPWGVDFRNPETMIYIYAIKKV